jgi:hypothetical protein
MGPLFRIADFGGEILEKLEPGAIIGSDGGPIFVPASDDDQMAPCPGSRLCLDAEGFTATSRGSRWASAPLKRRILDSTSSPKAHLTSACVPEIHW